MQVNVLYRPSQTIAQCWLAPNESVVAESGAMVGMSTNVQIQTQSGGVMSGLKRMLGGESFFRNTFTAAGGQGEVLFATSLCGDMTTLDVGETGWFLQNSTYVASTPDVKVETVSGGLRGMFSGAGLFALQCSGQGQVIVGAFGAIEKIPIDGSLVIETGHLVAWQSTLQYKLVAATSGWVGALLSGQGMVCEFSGSGYALIQTRNTQAYGRAIGKLLPPRKE
jgi:uncharacterized protein (TIGR00266 family)